MASSPPPSSTPPSSSRTRAAPVVTPPRALALAPILFPHLAAGHGLPTFASSLPLIRRGDPGGQAAAPRSIRHGRRDDDDDDDLASACFVTSPQTGGGFVSGLLRRAILKAP